MEEAPENGKESSHSPHANGIEKKMECMEAGYRLKQDVD
jgi:hypothetical protein